MQRKYTSFSGWGNISYPIALKVLFSITYGLNTRYGSTIAGHQSFFNFDNDKQKTTQVVVYLDSNVTEKYFLITGI